MADVAVTKDAVLIYNGRFDEELEPVVAKVLEKSDDCPSIRTQVKAVLEEGGYQVVTPWLVNRYQGDLCTIARAIQMA